MLYVRSMPDDRTRRAVIRDEALRLFADRGPESVTGRQIAEAAGVSSGLVVHHFGSKGGLRREVDEYVLAVPARHTRPRRGDLLARQ
ncbi:helix-turn-helix domain-containing protein [Streptomyces sp. NBC_01017]|uniref:helix-turn-helix domain-containing protein n=1 Tax=Streptomyces sp. NBC_01017 TaxID=2903721 RepID=UPI00386FB8EB